MGIIKVLKEKLRPFYMYIDKVITPYGYVYGKISKEFIKTKERYVELHLNDGDTESLYTVVAFNNALLIEKQILCLRKFIKESFDYIVFDNSSSLEETEKIRSVCESYEVSYVRLPENPINTCPFPHASESHAVCINYIFYNYVRKSNYKNWVMLDHDIYPIVNFSATDFLGTQNYTGMYVEKEKGRSYIWPGFCFMKVDWARNKKIDFSIDVRHTCDTGAANYKFLTDKDARFSITKTVSFDGNIAWGSNAFMAFDCGWVHCWNASNYINMESHDKKLFDFLSIVDNALQRERDITIEEFRDCYMKRTITEII